MIDKELAERVRRILGPTFTLDGITLVNFRDEYVIGHPLVAMALMERCDFVQIDRVPDEHGAEVWMVCAASHMHRHGEADSLPRAIVEACTQALEAK